MPGATPVIIIRMGVSVPIPMAEVVATIVGTGRATEEVGDNEATITMSVLMDNDEAAAVEMSMDLHISSVATSQHTLELRHRCLL
jgi:hypothetical protein